MFNREVSLPTYQNITVKNGSLEELTNLLRPDLNLKHPVVLNLRSLEPDQQREMIGLIENWYVSNGHSFKFPYPVYVLTDHEGTLSNLPLVKSPEELPKFFRQKEGKMNVKEAHVVSKNKLLQQEVKNTEVSANDANLKVYANIHRKIYELEEERLYYRSLLNRLMKVKKNG